MEGKQLVKLAVDFSAGTITAAAIREKYGDGVLSTVAALAAGGIAGLAADVALDVLDQHTGVVSAAGDVVDVGIGAVKGVFGDWF